MIEDRLKASGMEECITSVEICAASDRIAEALRGAEIRATPDHCFGLIWLGTESLLNAGVSVGAVHQLVDAVVAMRKLHGEPVNEKENMARVEMVTGPEAHKLAEEAQDRLVKRQFEELSPVAKNKKQVYH